MGRGEILSECIIEKIHKLCKYCGSIGFNIAYFAKNDSISLLQREPDTSCYTALFLALIEEKRCSRRSGARRESDHEGVATMMHWYQNRRRPVFGDSVKEGSRRTC